jgi:hypothetical protein
MRRLALLLSLAAVAHAQIVAPSAGQISPAGDMATSAEVSFQFQRPGLPVPRYTIVVHEDGTGTYQAQIAPVSGGSSAMGVSAAPQPVSQPIRISSPATQTIFKTARSLDRFNIPCESKAKNIADTGKKTLSYKGSDGQGSCLYNYSENKSITQLTDTFQAIAQTMDEGRKLQFLHRFDRLGLYSEMEVLSHEVEAKRVLELGNIAPALRSIVADEAVIQKVRERAAHLLALAEEATPSSPGK